MDTRAFIALHAVRVQGLLPGTEDGLPASLAEAGLVRHRRGRREGWVITPAGLVAHATELAARRTPGIEAAVLSAYRTFLEENAPFKQLCTDWQTIGAPDPAGREAFAEELGEVCDAAVAAVSAAAEVAPWFADYPGRLHAAAGAFAQGDDAALTSPLTESVHTVWAQVHEDFLVTLGRERTEADGA